MLEKNWLKTYDKDKQLSIIDGDNKVIIYRLY